MECWRGSVFMDYVKITFRIFSIMALVLILILKTGRRKIGELPVFDFLSIIILGSVVGADIADPQIKHLPTAYSVVLIVIIQNSISYFVIKSRKFGRKVTFEPIVVIQNGEFIKENMKKLKYSIENICMFLREKGVFDLNEVEFAIIEDSGNLSVLKKSQFQTVTPHDLQIPTPYKGMALPLILDGKVYEKNLHKLNLELNWLKSSLKDRGIDSFEEVFFAELNTQGDLFVSPTTKIQNITKDFKV
jgi:uncharacterized membrane protein YcaP (DUF421 family)